MFLLFDVAYWYYWDASWKLDKPAIISSVRKERASLWASVGFRRTARQTDGGTVRDAWMEKRHRSSTTRVFGPPTEVRVFLLQKLVHNRDITTELPEFRFWIVQFKIILWIPTVKYVPLCLQIGESLQTFIQEVLVFLSHFWSDSFRGKLFILLNGCMSSPKNQAPQRFHNPGAMLKSHFNCVC